MTDATLTALIGIVPNVLLLLIIAGTAIALRRPLLETVLPRVSRVSVIGLQVDLQPAEVRRALEGQRGPESRPLPADAELGAVGERARRNAHVLAGRTAAWIDDHPDWNLAERLVLHHLGVFVETAPSTEQAARVLEGGIGGRTVDVLISDMAADDGHSRLDEATALAAKHAIPVIFYVGRAKPGVPPGAFGLTNRPDELWHLVMDAMERRPHAAAAAHAARRPGP